MVRRRKVEDDYLGPSRGWAKVLHRTVMFILWPLRRPLWFLLIVAVLFLAPTFMGVKPAEVHLWYWNHIKDSSSDVGTIVTTKTKDIMPSLPKVELPSISVKSTVDKAVPAVKVVDMPVKESRRKMFEKAKSAPVAIDIMQPRALSANETNSPAATTNQVSANSDAKMVVNQAKVQPAKKKLALVYVNEPKFIFGPTKVINANELVVNRENVFLYGIYVDPNTTKGQEAKIFLDKTIDNQPVNCKIEAYTYQDVATGICIVNGINLNQLLVEKGFSKDVALTK